MVLPSAVVVTAGPAAVVLTIFVAVLATVFTTIFLARGLVGLTRYRDSGQQRARDEQCTEHL